MPLMDNSLSREGRIMASVQIQLLPTTTLPQYWCWHPGGSEATPCSGHCFAQEATRQVVIISP